MQPDTASAAGDSILDLLAKSNLSSNVAVALAIALIVAAVLLGAWSNILRDQSAADKKPFSLSRLQLLWWTVVIGISVILYFGAYRSMPALTETCLVLLGIGAGTTMTARIIDERQRANARGQMLLHQDEAGTNFFVDILSDETGLSVHRFQALVFNFVYGVSFLYGFLNSSTFPDYDAYVLSLLGISSAGYLGLKALENNKQPGGGASDELLDANVPASQQAVG